VIARGAARRTTRSPSAARAAPCYPRAVPKAPLTPTSTFVVAARSVFAAMPAAVLVVSPDGTVLCANALAGETLGVDLNALEGAPLDILLAPLEVLRAAVGGGRAGRVALDADHQLLFRMESFGDKHPLAGCVTLLIDHVPPPARGERGRTEGPKDPMPFSVADILQMCSVGPPRSLLIDCLDGDEVRGRIVVVESAGWFAEDRRGSGLPAFERLAFDPSGGVVCRGLTGPPGQRNLQGALGFLLLEAARLRDENSR
jgi:hypothetical protein